MRGRESCPQSFELYRLLRGRGGGSGSVSVEKSTSLRFGESQGAGIGDLVDSCVLSRRLDEAVGGVWSKEGLSFEAIIEARRESV